MNIVTKRRFIDREAIVLLSIAAIVCLAPGVYAAVNGSGFDVPTSVAFAIGTFALALLFMTVFRTKNERPSEAPRKPPGRTNGERP